MNRRYKDLDGEPASSITTSTFKTSLVARTGEGIFYGLFGYCSGAAQYLRLYDGVSESGRLLGVFAVPSANNFSLDIPPVGMAVNDGIFAVLSTSPSSLVASGSDAIITITFR